jgi:hypothetical protein
LADLPLTGLGIADNRVSDLSPLAGKRLTWLSCGVTDVSDLTPLKGMPLTYLNCSLTEVRDLSPLAGMPLTWLDCSQTQVVDLSPLKEMPLTTFFCLSTGVSELSPLEGLPLDHLGMNLRLYHADDARLIRALGLKTFNHFSFIGVPRQGPPLDEAWRQIELRRQAADQFAAETAKLPTAEQAAAVEAKLSKLNKGKIGALGRAIEEEAVVRVHLVLQPTTSDVTPLRAFADLKQLSLTGGPRWLDISAINSLPLEELTCSEEIAFRNAPVLSQMATLVTINGQAAQQYLDELPQTLRRQKTDPAAR